MAENTTGTRTQVLGFLQRMTLRQKLSIAGVVIAAAAALIALVTLVNKPSFGTLFGNLDSQDAAKVVEKLKEKGVPYVLENEGKTILVPRSQLYELRLAMAGEGLPHSGTIGYEIFDRTNLGVSDFVQKVNYRRALEGELARTILQLEEVEAARVHIVVPQKALFQEDQKPATASIVLKLRTGKPLGQEAIQGIVHLVASSIEGLETKNVSVIDSRGTLLSENQKSNTLASLTATQYDLQRKVEAYLSQKAQKMLTGVLGEGNAIVQVNAELDFRQVERTIEQYDPDKAAVRSEQSFEERSEGKEAAPSANRTNTIANYEVNRSIEHIVENQGNIRRLSVATLMNKTDSAAGNDGGGGAAVRPRSAAELAKLTDIVKRAVGYNPARGDEISVVDLPFTTKQHQEDLVYEETPFTDWKEWLDEILIGIAMVGGFFILHRLLRRFRERFKGAAEVAAAGRLPGAFGGMLENPGTTGRLGSPSVEVRQHISHIVQQTPDHASRVLKMWIDGK